MCVKTVNAVLCRLGLIYLLLAVNILPCAGVIPDVFPARNLSAVYLLALSVCLILYYAYRVSGEGRLPYMMKALSWMAFFLLLLRGVKYGVFAGVGVLARHTWYLYYVPMLGLPLFSFGVSLLVSHGEDASVPKKWFPFAGITVLFILLVLTNDLHGLVFRFRPGFENWNSDYTWGTLFYAVAAWQAILYLSAILLLVVKCRIGSAKKYALLTLVPFAVGIALSVLLMTGTMPRPNGAYLVEFPETLISTVAGVLECCMGLGLIPTNKNYAELFGVLSISAQITDRAGKAVCRSDSAVGLTPEQFLLPDGARLGEHTVLHRMDLPGGYGFWLDDVTALDRLNGELEEARETLAEETQLVRMRNDLKEKQAKIRQRTAVYDEIASRTRPHSARITALAKAAKGSGGPAFRERCRGRITLFAAFIKRYANLTLLSYEHDRIKVGELALSFSEVLRCLNFSGIPGELVNAASGEWRSAAALAVFEAFGTLLLKNVDAVSGIFIHLSDGSLCKLTLEDLVTGPDGETLDVLAQAGVAAHSVREDNVTYISFLPKKEVRP